MPGLASAASTPTTSPGGAEGHRIGRRHVEDAGRRPARRRLAGAGVHALLPGDAGRPAGAAPAPALRHRRRPHRRRCSTRSSTTPTASTPPTAACPTRCWPSSSGPAPARCATSSPPSRPSRTWSSARRSSAASSCRAGPAPARPRSACTAPRSSSTSTGSALDRDGVLVVGPNPMFLRYISAGAPVARRGAACARPPSPASSGVGQRRGRSTARAGRRSSATPGWPRCSARALAPRSGRRPTTCAFTTSWGPVTARPPATSPRRSDEIVGARRAATTPAASALRTRLLRLDPHGRRGAAGRGRRPPATAARGRPPAPAGARPGRRPRCGRRSAGRRSARAPAHQPHGRSAAAADGLLDGGEQRLRRAQGGPQARRRAVDGGRARRGRRVPGPREGVRPHLRPRRGRRGPGPLGHGLRALGRRCPSGSMTVLGDLAQATAPGRPDRRGLDVLGHLGSPPDAELAELGLGYRVPASVLDWANRLLPEAAPGVRPARSVRAGGRPPVVDRGRRPRRRGRGRGRRRRLPLRAASAWSHPTGPRRRAQRSGTGRRRCSSSDRRRRRASSSTPSWWSSRPRSWPGADREAGLRLLYVALTRAVQELVVVHREPLPPVLQR